MYLIRKFVTEENQETRLVIGYTYELESAVEFIEFNYGNPSNMEAIIGGNVLYYNEEHKKIAFWVREINLIQKGDKF
ncbi:hypothetical protein [Pectinatus cerevisiiphilus]|uniref:Uncharacterized protein n=1 Tax=Pectinatus cerevisiiphilus TaxID=86956 RepID=A0A4R3K8Q8_9FIRM|nr:hypothetical protein [Pectinatus cerevisiiphilus]TCS79268.1 hypothetical protein EDC37_10734 [Pectinatus cerevisiiphilus]